MSDTPDKGFELGDTDGAGHVPAGIAAASYGLSLAGKVVLAFAGETH
jgi:hypothetical protein